jgi:hypothetical protein
VTFINLKGPFVKLINPETKTFKVFSALQKGEAVTESKAKKMGIGNLAAEISRIRQHGFPEVTEYVLGKASRRIVAAGYKAIAMGIA